MGLFKPAVIKKASGMLALFLIISVLTPVLAFAGTWITNLTYTNGTVSGSVYTDTYDPNGVTVTFYNYSNGSQIGSAFAATYLRTASDATYYSFSKYIGSSYYHINVKADSTVNGSVYEDVYNTSGGGYFGGGGGGGSYVDGTTINVGSDGKVDASTLANLLKSNNVTLKLSGEVASIPASALLDADGKTITIIANNGATYVYPINVNLIKDWAKQVGVDAKDLTITVKLAKVSGDALTAVQNAIKTLGGKQLADPIDFSVTAEGNGKSVSVDDMGAFVTRSLPLSAKADPVTATGVVYSNGKLSFVPSVFSSDNDKNTVTIKRHSNSIYTAIEYSKTFSDIATHWAKNDIELLANKLIVDGATDTQFQPERNITRAEFAALVVRALGLNTSATGSNFKDVQASAWYAGVVNAAAKAGLIDGYEDGTFRPNNQINREELAAMVVRALKYAGVKTDVAADKQAQLLGKFQDANSIVWAKAEIAAAIDAGIVDGMTDVTLAPRDEATRAQSATMLKRLLSKASFIN